MTKTDDERLSLADALDGLQTAEAYAESRGLPVIANWIAAAYQTLGRVAPDADWTTDDSETHDYQ